MTAIMMNYTSTANNYTDTNCKKGLSSLKKYYPNKIFLSDKLPQFQVYLYWQAETSSKSSLHKEE